MRRLQRPDRRGGIQLLHLSGRVGGGQAHPHPGRLLGPNGELSDIQQAFVDEAAIQCGFCTPGLIMSAVEIVGTGKRYNRDELRKLISGHLCRCTGYENILNAMERIVEETYRVVGE